MDRTPHDLNERTVSLDGKQISEENAEKSQENILLSSDSAVNQPIQNGDNESSVDIEKDPQNKSGVLSGLYDCLETMIAAACFVLLLFSFIARPARVEGASMLSTLVEGDTLLVSDLFYTPSCGDIVVFQNHESSRTKPIVKRVIATEGQWIDIRFNDDRTMTVWVADTKEELATAEPLDESDYAQYLTDQRVLSSWSYPLQVPEGCCFCMGDNRNHSLDSRSADIGFVNRENIVGRVLVRIIPLSKFGFIS